MTTRNWLAVVLVVTVAALLGSRAVGEDSPFPAGRTQHEHVGLEYWMVMPADYDAGAENSLVVGFPSNGHSNFGFAVELERLTKLGFVVCTPAPKGGYFRAQHTEPVRNVVEHVRTELGVPKSRVHLISTRSGAAGLAAYAFDRTNESRSAYILNRYLGDDWLPKKPYPDLGIVLSMLDSEPNRRHGREFRAAFVKKLGPIWTRYAPEAESSGGGLVDTGKELDVAAWWFRAREGTSTIGSTPAFDWREPSEIRALLADGTKPSWKGTCFVYFYSSSDADDEVARTLETATLLDPAVLHFGAQSPAYRLDVESDREAFDALGLKSTPAVVLVTDSGKPKKSLQGEIKAKKLAALLRSIAANKKAPKK